MKSFQIAVVDDQGPITGFDRFLKLLYKNHYLKSDDFTLFEVAEYDQGLGLNKTLNSISFRIYTHNYGDRGFQKSFCEALHDFKERCNDFDIYVFDLNFIEQGNNSFYPINKDNSCETSKMFLKNLPLVEVTRVKRSTYIAGLEFYQILSPSDKPKLIYSAARETAPLRTSARLFSTRLADTHILDVIAPENLGNKDDDPFNSSNEDISKAFIGIDAYLQSRQISIIIRQSAHKLQELNGIIDSLCVEKISVVDKPLIPDDGNDANTENCWSLRTLFPKQVNEIELGIEETKNLKYIKEVINELSFRKLCKWIVGDHGGVEKTPVKDLVASKRDLILNRLTRLKFLESTPYMNIEDKAYQYYRKLSDVIPTQLTDEEFIDLCMNTVRDKIALGAKERVTVKVNYNQKEKDFYDIHLIKDLAFYYGLYQGDLDFLYKCIKGNNKHNLKNPPDDYNPEIRIETFQEKAGKSTLQPLLIRVMYPEDHELYSSWEELERNSRHPIRALYRKLEERFIICPHDISLIQQDTVDFVLLFVNRYKARIEIQWGNLVLLIDSDKNMSINFSEKEKTEFSFTINPIM